MIEINRRQINNNKYEINYHRRNDTANIEFSFQGEYFYFIPQLIIPKPKTPQMLIDIRYSNITFMCI